MVIDFVRPEYLFSPEERKLITREIVRALGDHSADIHCEVSRDSSGRGMVIVLERAPDRAPLIHLFEDYWKTRDMIREKVGDALADMDDPGRSERSLCKPLDS